jgi:hypothetical protein
LNTSVVELLESKGNVNPALRKHVVVLRRVILNAEIAEERQQRATEIFYTPLLYNPHPISQKNNTSSLASTLKNQSRIFVISQPLIKHLYAKNNPALHRSIGCTSFY